MVYLIKSAAMFGDNDENLRYLLKIGFTENIDRRKLEYKSCNPTFKLLYLIPGATKIDESNLHKHFNAFQYSGYGNEWFEYNEEIINYFREHTTKESIEYLNNEISSKPPHITTRKWRTMLKNLEKTRKIDEFIKDNPDSSLIRLLENFKTLTNFMDRMKLVCSELSKYSEEDQSRFFEVVDPDFKKYYNTLGRDKIKALIYRRNLLEKEYNRQVNNQNTNLSDLIYESFEVGRIYSNPEARSILANIFQVANFDEIPRVKILYKYFNLRECQITNKELNKREHAFEILSKKEISNE